MAILNNSNAISSGGYDINNSLRFRSSASAYLSRTPAGAGNRRTWTYSFWAKISTTTNNPTLSVDSASSTDRFHLGFGWTNPIEILDRQGSVNNIVLETTQVFRDPSAWYHCVVAFDTTQATASNRVKIYINGTQVTAFNTATYPSQNYDSLVNAVKLHQIARETSNGSQLNVMDGYLAEVNFIDGSQKAASDFGETDTTTGVWKPKAYTGTYGTNGFYLKFSDIAQTVSSNVGLGKDFSGNTNYWVTNNIYTTSSTDRQYDAMTDSPTLTSATVANYAVMNPLNKDSGITVTQANLQATGSVGDVDRTIFSTMSIPSSQKIYFEVVAVTGSSAGNYFAVGIAPSTLSLSAEVGITGSFGIESNQTTDSLKRISGTYTSYGAGTNIATNDIIQIAIDQASGKIWFGKNNTWFDSGNPSAGTNPATSTLSTSTEYFPVASFFRAGPTLAFNFGQRPFSYTPPTGFVRLNTYNLPDSTIKKGNTVMDATTYTGNGSTQTVTNAGAFKPDFVWVKTRNAGATDHCLFDAVRGVSKYLNSNNTGAEATYTGFGTTAFNSNGFTVVDNAGGGYLVNGSTGSPTYVGWQWQAGQGSTSSNTSGSITSTVSVNTTAGFSVVTYTGTGSNATVGHGLGVAPKMVIAKPRSAADNWRVYHAGVNGGVTPQNFQLVLNSTQAQTSASTIWNNTAPTSSVFSIGTDSGINGNGTTFVAYCWAEIAGFSKFTSYTGNGSADGPFIYTGFRPKFVMIKSSSVGGTGYHWTMYDTSRNTYNVADLQLCANLSDAEAVSNQIDILSNGFKIFGGGARHNGSGTTYIVVAFAENPFKNSLAR